MVLSLPPSLTLPRKGGGNNYDIIKLIYYRYCLRSRFTIFQEEKLDGAAKRAAA